MVDGEAGKGSARRPYNRERYDRNHDRIFNKIKQTFQNSMQCEHNFQFDHYYKNINGEIVSAFHC